MRTPAAVLATLMLAGGVAAREPATDQDGYPKQEPGAARVIVLRAPTDKDRAKLFPSGVPKSGYGVMRCTVTKAGEAGECEALKEEPAGSGLAAATLQLALAYKFKTVGRDETSAVGQKIMLRQNFLAPGDKPSAIPGAITNPDWVKKPTADSLAVVWPKKAMDEGVNGFATIQCNVTVEGYLDRCKVDSEGPEGYGFGAAALQLSSQFLMKPRTRDGKPTAGGEVRIPLMFRGMDGPNREDGSGIRTPASSTPVVADPVWTAAPTTAAVQAAYPAAASDVSVGQVMLRCHMTREGRLRGCETGSEIPSRKGFASAAKSLADQFQVQVGPDEAAKAAKALVDVPFRFRNPKGEDTAVLTQPRWIRTLSEVGAEALFPAAARAEKITTGVGQVDCAADTHGELVGCRVVGETPAGKGFGAAALEAAKAMQMNIWTRTGDPVDGRRITLPIRLTVKDLPATEGAK